MIKAIRGYARQARFLLRTISILKKALNMRWVEMMVRKMLIETWRDISKHRTKLIWRPKDYSFLLVLLLHIINNQYVLCVVKEIIFWQEGKKCISSSIVVNLYNIFWCSHLYIFSIILLPYLIKLYKNVQKYWFL